MSLKDEIREFDKLLQARRIRVNFSGATQEQIDFFNYAGEIKGELKEYFEIFPDAPVDFPYTNISFGELTLDKLQEFTLERESNPTLFPPTMICIAGCTYGPEVYFVNTDEVDAKGNYPVRFFLNEFDVDRHEAYKNAVIVANSITNLFKILTTLENNIKDDSWEISLGDMVTQFPTRRLIKSVSDKIQAELSAFESPDVVALWNTRIA